jgi:hypothetical protein
MSLLFLDLATLKDLDNGKPAIAFRRAVEDCVRDCSDRPTDKRSRKIVMEFILSPVPAEDPEFEGTFHADGVVGEFKIHTKIPHRQTRSYSFGLDRQHRLFFSSESPTNVKQTTFEDLNPETGKADRGEIQDVKDVEE